MRTLTCDRCHKDTDHLNPVYDDSGERSVILDWCDGCRREWANFCTGCHSYVPYNQFPWENGVRRPTLCLACRRPAPTDEGARPRNAMREALKELDTIDVLALRPTLGHSVVGARRTLSNALEGDANG